MQAGLHRDNPRVHVHGCFAYLLWRPEALQVDHAGKASMDVEGLALEPRIRISRRGNIVINYCANAGAMAGTMAGTRALTTPRQWPLFHFRSITLTNSQNLLERLCDSSPHRTSTHLLGEDPTQCMQGCPQTERSIRRFGDKVPPVPIAIDPGRCVSGALEFAVIDYVFLLPGKVAACISRAQAA